MEKNDRHCKTVAVCLILGKREKKQDRIFEVGRRRKQS